MGAVSVFHFGAVMSGQGEQDFDLVMRVNLHGTLNLLEAARQCGATRPRFILASAGATLGSGAPTDYVEKEDRRKRKRAAKKEQQRKQKQKHKGAAGS